MENIEHVVPQVGPISLRLYSPADSLYQKLVEKKEINRLGKLRHLGALSIALEGARLARWDYSVALLYYSSKMSIPKFNSKFSIGRVDFSSTISALQVASLAWNIGHIPGTFSVEKGVYRYLNNISPQYPVSGLDWNFRNNDEVKFIIKRANQLLLDTDFYSLSKIFAIVKLLSFCDDENDELYKLTIDFIAPLFLDYDYPHSKQWSKIRESFTLIRHVSYLTLDAPFCGDSWIPNIPVFFESQVNRHGADLYNLSSKLSEPLSPIETNIYDRLYHCDKARTETAIFAAQVFSRLSRSQDPINTIHRWLGAGLTRDLKLGRRLLHSQVKRLSTIRFRTHFSKLPNSIVKTEKELINKGYCHSSVYKYHSWNSEALFEPDEYTIDVIKKGNYTNNDLGRLLVWLINKFDDFSVDKHDHLGITKKLELENAYKDIFSQAFENLYPQFEVKFDAWPLNNFNIFPSLNIKDSKGAVWASTGKLEDKVTRNIVYDRSGKINTHQTDLYKELIGIKELRTYYRNSLDAGVSPKCRWLIFTSSITLNKDGQPVMEFDGGLLKISSRSGKLTWYGLETKNGNENPASSLRKRMRKQNITGNVVSIDTTHAYAEIGMQT
ncbi:hypothetical protein C9J44_14810 [Photobacterium sp. GB-27]|uniref:hypothetical protein n=1 Tax=Photobacterium sp. GB-27 TaxID=2022109 RepID=UPI000D16D23C|nr:hypothetical protein [Photobacterium sp. GB-27]PSV34626.1 hypothetical protein C9J44_14810 [Photobacterium sp. GB-27]